MKMKKFLALTATVAMVASMAIKKKERQIQNLIQQMISLLFQEKMVLEQEEHLSNYLELKKKMHQEKKWITQQRKQMLQTVHRLCCQQ